MRIEVLLEVPVCVRLWYREQAIVQPHFGINRVWCADPVNRAFDLSAGRGAAGFAVKVRGATEFADGTGSVFEDLVAFYDVGILQPNLAAGPQPKIFRG